MANVLIIMCDQLRHDAVGYVNSSVRTPNIDKLAGGGVVCSRAYTVSPQCQPSRASILTGRYPTAHRVWWNETDINRSEVTLGNVLSGAGYNTGYFGKLHVQFDGVPTSLVANHFGFKSTYLTEDWFDGLNGVEFRSVLKLVRDEFCLPMKSNNWAGRFTNQECHHDEMIVSKAIEFIRTVKSPFCAVVSFYGPHPPYACPVEYYEFYKNVDFELPVGVSNNDVLLSVEEWIELRRSYYGNISWMDYNVGRLLECVGDDTVIVFLSDHGDILGDHGLFSKGLYAYEGVVRIPLVFKHNGLLPVMKYDYLVQSIDVLPTLCGLLGVSGPVGVQGKQLLNGFVGDRGLNRFVLSMIGRDSRLRMVCNGRYKYWLCGNVEYLFDLERDPGELVNVEKSLPGVRSEMRLLLAKALIEAEDKL